MLITKISLKPKKALKMFARVLGDCFLLVVYLFIHTLFFFSRNLKQEQSQIRLNLVVAIAIAQIIFLAGINATARKVRMINKAINQSKHNAFLLLHSLLSIKPIKIVWISL